MKEMLLTDARYEKVIGFLAESCEALKDSRLLSDKKKYNQAMCCLDILSSVENTQYDMQYKGISLMLTEEQKEQIICCLIDFIPFRRVKRKEDKL